MTALLIIGAVALYAAIGGAVGYVVRQAKSDHVFGIDPEEFFAGLFWPAFVPVALGALAARAIIRHIERRRALAAQREREMAAAQKEVDACLH